MLEISGLCKSFGGLQASQSVSLTVPQGGITSLIGPNGAGKTTLFALITGFHKPDSGTVRFLGEDITGMPPEAIAKRGMIRTFQTVQPFAGQTVRENIAVGAHLKIRDVMPVINAIRDAGVTILLIEHVMQAVMSLSDFTWVLNQGAIIAQGPPREVASNPDVIEAYLGKGMAERIARREAASA